MKWINRKESLIDSLERYRVSMSYSQKEMADRLGIGFTTYKNFIAGSINRIDFKVISRLHEMSGISFEELSGEKGTEVMAEIRALSEPQLAFIKAVIDTEYALIGHPEGNDMVTCLELPADLYDGMIYDTSTISTVDVSAYRKKYGDLIHSAILVNSNHLHPAYNLGDVLLICHRSPRDGDIGIFINKETNRAYIRKYHNLKPVILEPVNGLGRVFTVDPNDKADMDKWIRYGVVLAKMRQKDIPRGDSARDSEG